MIHLTGTTIDAGSQPGLVVIYPPPGVRTLGNGTLRSPAKEIEHAAAVPAFLREQ